MKKKRKLQCINLSFNERIAGCCGIATIRKDLGRSWLLESHYNVWKGKRLWWFSLVVMIQWFMLTFSPMTVWLGRNNLLFQCDRGRSQWNPAAPPLVPHALCAFGSLSVWSCSGHHNKPTPSDEAQGGGSSARGRFHRAVGVTHRSCKVSTTRKCTRKACYKERWYSCYPGIRVSIKSPDKDCTWAFKLWKVNYIISSFDGKIQSSTGFQLNHKPN